MERDPIQGCALIELASWDSATAPREDAAARKDAEGLKKLHCSGLSTNQNDEAWQLAGCGIFGVRPQVIALAPGSQIDISRRGLVLDTPAGRKTMPLSGGMWAAATKSRSCDTRASIRRSAWRCPLATSSK